MYRFEWTRLADSLVIPFHLACISAVILLVQYNKTRHSRYSPPGVLLNQRSRLTIARLFRMTRADVDARGGLSIFVHKTLRLFSCLALLGITIFGAIYGVDDHGGNIGGTSQYLLGIFFVSFCARRSYLPEIDKMNLSRPIPQFWHYYVWSLNHKRVD